MRNRILYIHGFGSCGSGFKVQILRRFFGNHSVLAPDLPVDPAETLEVLQALLADEDIDLMVGSSLGGFYAVWLNGLLPNALPAVLINPAIKPWEPLAPLVGTHPHWCTGRPFELTLDHIDQLTQLDRRPDPAQEKYLVLLAEGDEVLDHRKSADFFGEFEIMIAAEDNHRFKRLADYLPTIARFREDAGNIR